MCSPGTAYRCTKFAQSRSPRTSMRSSQSWRRKKKRSPSAFPMNRRHDCCGAACCIRSRVRSGPRATSYAGSAFQAHLVSFRAVQVHAGAVWNWYNTLDGELISDGFYLYVDVELTANVFFEHRNSKREVIFAEERKRPIKFTVHSNMMSPNKNVRLWGTQLRWRIADIDDLLWFKAVAMNVKHEAAKILHEEKVKRS